MSAQAFEPAAAQECEGVVAAPVKAWEKAPCGHFFDDIDTVMQKLKMPHEDELIRLYENDRRNIDPLSPTPSDSGDEDDDEYDKAETVEDSIFHEKLKQFDYIDARFLEQSCSNSDISDCVITNSDELELCPDEYARFYELDANELRPRKPLSETRSQRVIARRLCSLLYDVHGNFQNQLLASLAYYLRHKLPL